MCLISGRRVAQAGHAALIPAQEATAADWVAASQLSDFDFSSIPIAPDTSTTTRLMLGRWRPNGRVPPPAVAIAGGFVAVKMIRSRFVDINTARISHELSAHASMCDAEGESPGARHFVRLIDSYACVEDIEFKLFMVQELCLGTLADRFKTTHIMPMSERERIYIALATARALRFMHHPDHPVMHRDVRSSNIFFGIDGAVLLGDFGLSVRGYSVIAA